MSVDASGTWWRGTEARDIRAYLEAFTSSRRNVRVTDYRTAICPCGSKAFLVEGDPKEGAVRRTCLNCGTEHLILDSDERWEDAAPVRCRCVDCACEVHELGAGFALRPDKEIAWVFVGVRCVNCGVLGSFADWEIGYAPSRHLLDLA